MDLLVEGSYIRQAVTTVFIEENKFLGNHNYGVYAYDPAGLPKDIYIKEIISLVLEMQQLTFTLLTH